jgi:antitoxin component of MazEF toxin-antitoxin module
MCLKTVRKIVRVGGSHAITLPSYVIKGDKVSVAAEGRLIIMDPRGEISEDDLLDFLESNIEPIFWE